MAYYHSDSYESGWQNWSVKFPQDFRQRRGYDLTKYPPAITGRIVGDLATTEGFLWDFRRTIGDLYADNNYGRLKHQPRPDSRRVTFTPWKHWGKNDPLLPSGLLGPVMLLEAKRVEVK